MSKRVHIVGAGIGGLAAGAYLARAGWAVRIYERSTTIGGRARSLTENASTFNFGPHALYVAGEAAKVLSELGVPVTGGIPTGAGGLAIRGGVMHTLPVGFVSMLTTGLLTLRDKLAASRILAGLPRVSTAEWRGQTVRAWVESVADGAALRDYLYAMVRVSTYANAPDFADAGATIAQVQLALKGSVRYLDGGWQTIVDGLKGVACAAGAVLQTGAPITSLVPFRGDAVIIAAAPTVAGHLLGRDFDLTPVKAACLDVGLDALPVPERRFALGIDAPTYFSVHSQYANLAERGGVVIQVAKYLAPHDDEPAEHHRRELEATLERLQPGYRAHLVRERYLPQMTVTHALVTPSGRPNGEVQCDGMNVQLVGDWVGPDGMLADAALCSARAAAQRIVAGVTSSKSAAA